MLYAASRQTRGLVEATSATWHHDYTCPSCHARVFLRSGNERTPHFAHYPGEGQPECEEYYPGVSISSGTPAARPRLAVEDHRDELGLVVQEGGEDTWDLLLRVPELPDAELGIASLNALRDAFIEIQVDGSMVGRLSGLEVRPGCGVARAPVPPSWQMYSTQPAGHWPNGVNRERWRRMAPGLATLGSLFRLRGGEWARLSPGSLVQWGEDMVLIGDDRCPPPSQTRSEAANPRSTGAIRWRLWRIHLPFEPSDPIGSWLHRLGYRVAPRTWTATLLSIPISFGRGAQPCFRAGEPVTVELTPPTVSSNTLLSLRYDTNTHSLPIGANGLDRVYVAVSTAGPAEVGLTVSGDDSTTITFDILRPTTAAVQTLLEKVPRLRVWVGQHCRTAWSSEPSGRVPRSGEVKIEVGVDGARFDILVHSRGPRRVLTSLSTRDAEKAIAEALKDATLVEIDGANLGRVSLPLPPSDQHDRADTPRLSLWLRAAAASAPRAERTFPVFVAGPTAPHLSLIHASSRLLPLVRALSRSRHRGDGAIP
jgi:hypothetical protein